MEEFEPIQYETPEPNEEKENIDFYEELKINKENEEYLNFQMICFVINIIILKMNFKIYQ